MAKGETLFNGEKEYRYFDRKFPGTLAHPPDEGMLLIFLTPSLSTAFFRRRRR
jgi:hypothetical protein